MLHVLVFDLDGVITNPVDSNVNTNVLDCIRKLLTTGVPVAVNTGRSYDWVATHFIQPLRALGVSDFVNVIIVCEKGGEIITFNDTGAADIQSSAFALPNEIYSIVKQIFDQSRLPAMFWDQSKRTMATIEKYPAASLEAFHEQQKTLVNLLQTAFVNRDVRIDATVIATDVEHVSAGKDAGAELILSWAQKQFNVEIFRFTSFGDSVSDYEMARHFASSGQLSTFVYVGRPTDSIDQHPDVSLKLLTNRFAEGTFDYLKTNLDIL